jgi:transcriptional regulator with XRE-family HTH domain
VSELVDDLANLFQDEERRYAYTETFLNTYVAAQLKALREQSGMSQGELATIVKTKQSGISRLENANYSAWKIETLRKLARAFGVRLKISFEEFGTLIPEVENFRKDTLSRRKFVDDPSFKPTGKSRGSSNSIGWSQSSRNCAISPPPRKPADIEIATIEPKLAGGAVSGRSHVGR